MYNLNILKKKKKLNHIIVVILNCIRAYAQGYTLVLINA